VCFSVEWSRSQVFRHYARRLLSRTFRSCRKSESLSRRPVCSWVRHQSGRRILWTQPGEGFCLVLSCQFISDVKITVRPRVNPTWLALLNVGLYAQLRARLHDTTDWTKQPVEQPAASRKQRVNRLSTGWMFVYALQPVVQPVVKPVEQPVE